MNHNETLRSGTLFVISAPSGAGKTTLCRKLLDSFADLAYSISHTTRKPRGKEKNGADYFFIGKEEFLEGVEKGRWAEWAEVHGNYYGTSAEFLDRELATGRSVLLDIDVQGMEQILKRYPSCATIFIMPPNLEELKSRMEKRGEDGMATIEKRMVNAKKEIERKDFYRHVVVNDRLSEAASELISIVGQYMDNESVS